MDIIVTTPKSQMKQAAEEARQCIAQGGGHYFRRFAFRPRIEPGDRVYYVEDGYVRGFARVVSVRTQGETWCDTTGRAFPPGTYVIMAAKTWLWVEPVPMKGFMGLRYAPVAWREIEVVGDWLAPRPPPSPRRPPREDPAIRRM